VTSDGASSRLPTITARLAPEEKRRFVELAASRGVSESALAVMTLRALLATSGSPAPETSGASQRRPATDRITIRLRPGDGAAVNARAARRRTKASTYVAALVRAHLAANPPLLADELAAFKEAAAHLSGIGGALALIARRGAQGGPLPPDLREELAQTRAAIAVLERRTCALAGAALQTWESRYG
jgi:hypothetical protein